MTAPITRYARASSGLVRELSWWDVFLITLSAPTGSGIMYYAVRTSGHPGGNISLAFVLGMILFLPFVISSAILASTLPRSGGPYVAISRLLHPLIGFLAAALLIFAESSLIGVVGFLVMAISGGMAGGVAQAYHWGALLSFSECLQGPIGSIGGGILWVLIFWFIMLQRPSVFRYLLRGLFTITLLPAAVAALLFFSATQSEALARFDALWGAGTVQKIFLAASANGWHQDAFSFSATMGLLLIVIWAFNGIEVASYAGGEVQVPTRSFWKGLLLGWLAVGAVYILFVYAVTRSFGDFINAYDFLFTSHSETLSQIMPSITPSIPFYLMPLLRHPFIALLFSLLFVLWFAKMMPPLHLATSRLLFALAMDRLLPERVATVNPRTAAPTWASHITALIAIGGVFMYFFDVKTLLGSLMFCTMFIAWANGLVLFLLPFKHRDLVPPGWLRARVLVLPAVSWVGLVAMAAGFFLLYLTLRDVTRSVLVALLLFIASILSFYVLRVRALRAEGFTTAGAELLPPD